MTRDKITWPTRPGEPAIAGLSSLCFMYIMYIRMSIATDGDDLENTNLRQSAVQPLEQGSSKTLAQSQYAFTIFKIIPLLESGEKL